MNIFKRIFKWLFNEEHRYFVKKLSGVQKMVWDLEFKRSKISMLREERRQGYDNSRSKIANLDTQIKAAKENPETKSEDVKKLEDDKAVLDKDVERYLEQVKVLDTEIMGATPSADYPDGVQGINQQLDALRELQLMLIAYKKKL